MNMSTETDVKHVERDRDNICNWWREKNDRSRQEQSQIDKDKEVRINCREKVNIEQRELKNGSRGVKNRNR